VPVIRGGTRLGSRAAHGDRQFLGLLDLALDILLLRHAFRVSSALLQHVYSKPPARSWSGLQQQRLFGRWSRSLGKARDLALDILLLRHAFRVFRLPFQGVPELFQGFETTFQTTAAAVIRTMTERYRLGRALLERPPR
jgi:hypothetical protein